MRITYFIALILVLSNLGFAIACVDLTNNATWSGNVSGSITHGLRMGRSYYAEGHIPSHQVSRR